MVIGLFGCSAAANDDDVRDISDVTGDVQVDDGVNVSDEGSDVQEVRWDDNGLDDSVGKDVLKDIDSGEGDYIGDALLDHGEVTDLFEVVADVHAFDSADGDAVISDPCAMCDDPAANPDPMCLVGYCRATPFEEGAYLCSESVMCPRGSRCEDFSGICVTDSCDFMSRSCDDGLLCTADSCDSTLGCRHICTCNSCDAVTEPGQESADCDDQSKCTRDFCVSGIVEHCGDEVALLCNYERVDCDDGDEYTVDVCSPEDGCVHWETLACHSDEECQDDDMCTVEEYCDVLSGLCHRDIKNCNDNDVCTDDDCDSSTGCVNTRNDVDCDCSYPDQGWSCDDGNACTVDSCQITLLPYRHGACYNISVDCDDDDPCTLDWCDKETGCQHTATECP